jgi:hypothetical protein
MSCLQWIFNNRVHVQTANRRSTDCERLSCLKFNYLWIILILDGPLLRYSIKFFAFSFFHKTSIFPTVRQLNKKTVRNHVRKIDNVWFDASSSPLSNCENRSPLSCFYQKLFQKYTRAFMLTAHMRKKQILSKFYYYDNSLIVTKSHGKIERNTLYLLVKKEIFLYPCLTKKKYLPHYFWYALSTISKPQTFWIFLLFIQFPTILSSRYHENKFNQPSLIKRSSGCSKYMTKLRSDSFRGYRKI